MASRTLRTKLRRDVRRQWPQFVAITVTIMLGVALFAASYDAFRNLQASYANLHDELATPDLWITGGDVTAIAAAAGATDGVATVHTRTQADVALRVGAEKLRGRVVGLPAGAAPPVSRVLALTGADVVDDGGALVERHMQDHFGLAVGDTVDALSADGATWVPLDVAGGVASAEYIWPARSRQELLTLPDDFGVLFVTEADARALAGNGPAQVLVALAPDADPAVLDALRSTALGLGATEVLDATQQPSNAALQEDIDGFSEMSTAFPLLFLTAAGMAAYVLVTRRVQQERALIGMMLASGVRRRAVLGHYLSFGLLAGVLGSAVGVGVGMAAARTMTRLYLGFIALPSAVAVHDVRAVTVLGGLAYGVLAGIVSALPPARLAARVEPAEAMRDVVPVAGGGVSLLERVVPPLRRLPTRWLLVLRGIGRNRRRTAYTVIGVTLSLLLVLVSWSMLDTMDALLRTEFDEVALQDARVELAGPQPAAVLERLAAVDGVADVEPVTAVPVALDGPDGSYGTVLLGLSPTTTMHGFLLEDGSTTSLSDGGVLVGVGARDQLGLAPGDLVTVRVDALDRTLTLPLDAWVDEPLGTFVYVSRDALAREVGAQLPVSSALLRLDDGADRDAVRQAVEALPEVASFEDAQALVALYDQFTGLFHGFIGAMLALGALMAFAIMFTTMSVNIVERSREVATMQASGVRSGQLARLISSENLLMTLLGIVPGLVAGVLGGRALMASYSSDLFRLDLVVRPLTLVVSSLAIVVVALVSQWPSLRAVRRLDIAAVVRARDT